MKKKTVSLSMFTELVRDNINVFEQLYEKKHAQDPENYPLELPSNNSGLWMEFFTDFCEDGVV